MIVHCLERALEADIGPVFVAAGDKEIVDAVSDHGGRAILTDPDHPSGSDRIFEGLGRIDPDGKYDVIVNVQGDLPILEPASIRAAQDALATPETAIGTIAAPIAHAGERDNPNVVKVFAGFADGSRVTRAIAFSRAAIPWGDGPHYHHIGLYAYRRDALARFVALPPGILEQREKLEQLRALENGMRIDVALVGQVPFGVDTQEDLDRARILLAG